MRAIELPARVMVTVNTDRTKVLQINILKTVRAMRSVYSEVLCEHFVPTVYALLARGPHVLKAGSNAFIAEEQGFAEVGA
jgi:hypothetical protein